MVSSEGFSLAWHPLFIFRCRCCMRWPKFPGFWRVVCYTGGFWWIYIFPQLPTCTVLVLSVSWTEGSCSSNIVVFKDVLTFNFRFFQFRISSGISDDLEKRCKVTSKYQIHLFPSFWVLSRALLVASINHS